MFYIGCPAWGYREWVGQDNFFPQKTPASEFLRLYSRKLTTVEGKPSFFRNGVRRRWMLHLLDWLAVYER